MSDKALPSKAEFSVFLFVSMAYFGLAYVGLELASINPSATPIWPATGLAIAVVLRFGYRLASAIFISVFAINYITAGSLLASAGIAGGNALEAVVAAYLVRNYANGLNVFDSPSGVGLFALIAGAATTISATVGTISLNFASLASPEDAPLVWTTWWFGDFAGAIVVTPAVLLWLTSRSDTISRDQLTRTFIAYAAAVIVGLIAFSPLFPQTNLRDPLGFLAVFPLMWAALKRGPRDTATAAAILGAFAVWGTLMSGGPFGRATLNESFLLLLMFLVSMCIPSLALSADIASRRRAHEHQQFLLREINHRVGNTLAVLNSVFRRSVRHASSIEELSQAFQRRVMSLAASHKLLSESDWQSASVRELILTAVEPFCAPEELCEFEGPEARLPGQLVTTVAMVLHELATNAAKHGALKAEGGRLRVKWNIADDHVRIDWLELGGCVPHNAEVRAGYGRTLIDTSLTSVGGSASWSLKPDGLHVVLTIPMQAK